MCDLSCTTSHTNALLNSKLQTTASRTRNGHSWSGCLLVCQSNERWCSQWLQSRWIKNSSGRDFSGSFSVQTWTRSRLTVCSKNWRRTRNLRIQFRSAKFSSLISLWISYQNKSFTATTKIWDVSKSERNFLQKFGCQEDNVTVWPFVVSYSR